MIVDNVNYFEEEEETSLQIPLLSITVGYIIDIRKHSCVQPLFPVAVLYRSNIEKHDCVQIVLFSKCFMKLCHSTKSFNKLSYFFFKSQYNRNVAFLHQNRSLNSSILVRVIGSQPTNITYYYAK